MPNGAGGSSSWLFEWDDAMTRTIISSGPGGEVNHEDYAEAIEASYMRYDTDDEGRHMRMVLRTRQVDGEWQEYSSSESESDSESDEESDSESDEHGEDSDEGYDEGVGFPPPHHVEGTNSGTGFPPLEEDGRPIAYISAQYDFSVLAEVIVDQQMVDSGLVCSICLIAPELGKTVTNLSCEHIFHTACITEWLSQTPTCPLCRRIAVPLRGRSHLGGFNRINVSGTSSGRRDEPHERHVHWAFLTMS